MTTLSRARILPRERAGTAVPRRLYDGSPTPAEVPRALLVRRAEHAARRRAEELLDDARAEASTLLAEVRREATALRHRAAREAQAAVRRDTSAAVETIRAGLTGEQRADHLVTLARVLAEQLLGDELQLRPEVIEHRARSLLQRAAGATRLVIACHPDRRDALAALVPTLHRDVSVRVDTALDPADLRVETDVGEVEAYARKELRRLAEALRGSQG